MNELQEKIFKVLVSLMSDEDFAASVNHSAIRYGFLNYVAKFSLARDEYYASPAAYALLQSNGFLRSNGLKRGLKSKLNRFTYEHVIPANVVGRELLKYQNDVAKWRDILLYADHVTILTAPENSFLRGSHWSSMPDDFEFFISDPFSRYIHAGLPRVEELYVVPVFGALRR